MATFVAGGSVPATATAGNGVTDAALECEAWAADDDRVRLLRLLASTKPLPSPPFSSDSHTAPRFHRWLSAAAFGWKRRPSFTLLVCALLCLLLCGLLFLLPRAPISRFGKVAAPHSSLLYGDRSALKWHVETTADKLSSRQLHHASVSHTTASLSPFPPLSSLLNNRTSSSSLHGVSCFARCINSASVTGRRRAAVVSTRSSHPTAAMLSVASLSSGWCVIVLSERDGAARRVWTSEVSRAAALLDYARSVSLVTGHNLSASSVLSRPSAFSLTNSSFAHLCYIDPAEQRHLPYSLAEQVTSGAADVRHIGYLLAMHAQATVILDLHEHTMYLPDTARTAYRDLPYERHAAHFLSAQPFARTFRHQRQQHTLDANVSVLNAYALYGRVDSWPRGLPVDWVGDSLPADVLSVDGVCLTNRSEALPPRRLCRPVVQHFLAGHYVDVDSTYWSTSSAPRRPPFDFLAPTGRLIQPYIARQAPAVAVPSGTYTPFNTRSTLFLPDAFAALLLPTTQHRCHADIIRAYIAQTAITYFDSPDAAQCLVITPQHFAQLHDEHGDTTSKRQHSKPMTMLESLLSALTLRQRGGSRQLAWNVTQTSELVRWLYAELIDSGEVDNADAVLVHAWLSDISRMPHASEDGRGEATAAAASPSAIRLPNASSSSDCFPSYSLPGVDLSRPSAPLNHVAAHPDGVLASDGVHYPMSAYSDGFLFPDKYVDGAFIDERSLHGADPYSVKPAGRWLPYPPHRHPPKPRVDFILRAFSGYSPLTSYMMRSLDAFVPWKQLGSTIIVLDDNDEDRQYAASLPDDVQVYFEPKPAFFAEWGSAQQQTGQLGVERKANGYALGLYSNWISDRYSDADYICVLDPDMMFITRASLPLMFDWDEQQSLYKPIWICKDEPEEQFVESSYRLFGLDKDTAPGCMYQLPVCIHRSTLKRVRLRLNEDFNRTNPADYSQYGLDAALDRDSDYEQYGRQYDAQRAKAGADSLMAAREGGVAPAAFDRTYMRMVNRDLDHAVCQFCVWGSYIMLHDNERRLYSFYRQGNKRADSSCPQIRVGTHTGYLVPQPKMSPDYYQLGDRLLIDGLCHASLPSDCIAPICKKRGQLFDALSVRSASHAGLPFGVDHQSLLWRWELFDVYSNKAHEDRCRPYNIAAAQQLYEWIQQFDLAPQIQRDKHCTRLHLTQAADQRPNIIE